MWQPYISLTHHGASGSAWVYVFVFGLLLTFGTQDARAGFPCPSSSCSCVPWTRSSSKVQNITCTNVGLTAVPTYNKTGDDVIKFVLSHNGITQIEQINFQYLSNLTYLDLSYNNIASIEPDTFFNVSNLQYLSYAGNTNLGFPSELPDTIESLDLSYMNLESIQDSSFNNLNHLKDLVLDGNHLTQLKKNTFNGLSNLERVYLDGNVIDTIHRDAFEVSTNLLELYLNNNNLTSIEDGTFDNNPNLAVIDLSNNFLTTISITLFSQQTAVTIDVSNNLFICDCDVRDYLFSLSTDADKTLSNKETITCTKNGVTNVYLDWHDLSCPGYLGYSCNDSTDCMVRNSECSNGVCSCKNFYYDNNEISVLGGLCRPTVQLDYPCDINAACDTTNAECRRSSSSTSTTCLCKTGYYDTSPVYLGGSCEPQVQLGASCTSGLSMCNTTNAECISNICTCDSDHYDNNTVNVAEGECLPKLDLGAACNYTYQCKPENAECLSNTCLCSTGHYDFQNNGQCKEPTNFFSCYPSNTFNVEVHFRLSQINNSVAACMEFCFKNNAWYYKVQDGVCICGDLADTARCCPLVMEYCQFKHYLGPNTGIVTAGITISHVPLLYVGSPHAFVVASNMSSVYLVLNPGDSETNHTFSSHSVTFSHTYTRWGVFTFTVYACVQSTDLVCDVTWIPVRVQVPQENLTAYLTGHSKADVNSDLTGTTATFSQGLDTQFKWLLTDPQGTNKAAQGCEAPWIAHRQTCIQLVTTAADFTSATNECTAKGASLLKMNFEVEIDEVISLLGASSIDMLTGARRIGGVWTWTSDNSRTFITDSKLVNSANDCVIVQGTASTLTTVSCSTPNQYVCMKDPVDCPYGGIGSTNGYCYLLSYAASTSSRNWTNAQSFCSITYNGFLANITDIDTDTMVAGLLTTYNVNEAYFGLHDRFTDGSFHWAADNSSFDINKPDYNANITENVYDCFTISKERTWRSVDCDMLLPFVCQYSVSIDRVSVTARLTGTPDLMIESGGRLTAVTSTETHTDSNYETDVILFPGIVMGTGVVLYWNFRPENLPVATPIAFQIYRPSCQNNQNLVQPGCAGTMFSTCENTNPSCPSSATYSEDKYFCYLSNTFKYFGQPCTCTSEGSLAASACSSYGREPTYILKGSTSFTIPQGSETPIKLTAGLDVDELDILAIQVPRDSYPIKYDSSSNDDAKQTIYRIPYTGWVEKYNEVSSTSKTVLNHTFFFQAIYTQNSYRNLPQSIGFVSSVGSYRIAIVTDTESRSFEIQLEESIEDIQMIYPVISEGGVGDHLGVVNTEFNTSINFTISVGRGSNLTSIWSFDSLAVTFSETCPSDVIISDNSRCNSSLSPTEKPFSFIEHRMNSIGEQILQVVISNILESVTKNVTVRTEKRISGLNIVLVNTSLTGNFVPLGVDSLFKTTISEGTGVTYVYYVNGSPVSGNVTDQTILYTFTHTGTFVVGVQAFNNLGNETTNIIVYSKIAANLRNCNFIQSSYVAATNIPVALTVQCNVEENAEVNSEFRSNATSVNSTTPTVTTTSDQHQWNHEETFSSAGNVTVYVTIKDPFQEVLVSTLVIVYNAIPFANLNISSTEIYPGETVILHASTPSSPGNYGIVIYSFDFGYGNNVTAENGSVTHTYASPGNHTVTMTASSGPSNFTVVKYVVVYLNVTGLTLSYNGPKQTGSLTTFNASILTGNFVFCRFLSTQFNTTVSSSSFSFAFPSAGDYNVSVMCFNALSQQQSNIIAYILDPSDLRITALKINNNVNPGCIESVTQNIYSLELLHYDIDGLTITWDFQNGQTQNTNVTYINQSYAGAGNYSLNVTVTYSAQNAVASIQRTICVQDRITSASISVLNILGLPSSKQHRDSATVTVGTGSALVYTWSSNATIVNSTTGSTIEFEVTSDGFYFISVIVANEINSELVTSTIQVIYEIDGLDMICTAVIENNREFFIENGTEITCNAVVSQGTDVVFAWDFDDSFGTNQTGNQASHTYVAIGIHNITLTAANAVGSSVELVVLHVEVPLTDVRLALNDQVWKSNLVNPTQVKDISINNAAVFTAIATPTGMTLNYTWVFDTGLQAITNSSKVGYHNFTTTGYKTTSLTASNSINNVSKSVSFYVIREITSLIVKDGDIVLPTSGNYMISVNSSKNFTVASTEIVPDTTTYIWRIKKGNVLVGSNTFDFIIFTFTEEENYTLSVEVRNSLGSVTTVYIIEATKPISGPYINATGSSNVTAGSVINLTGYVTEGRNVIYTWSYIQAPASEVFPSPNIGQNVAVTLTSVGIYVIQLRVENSISTPLTTTYSVNVMTGVTGVNITVTTPYTNAVMVGTMLNLQATVTAGTNLTFLWQVYTSENTGSVIASGTGQLFPFTFHNQALYNITLQVQNYASSGFSSLQIYSLRTVPSFSLNVSGSTFVNSIQAFAVTTNDNVIVSNNITDTAYISFAWKLNNIVVGTTVNMTEQFSSPGSYVLILEATNLISQSSSSVSIVVQDAISNFTVSNCVGKHLIDVGITSIASYATGSDVTVIWERESLTQSTGTKIITQFHQTGNYSMNVTASNYVTTTIQHCMLEIQGPIGSLTISKSEYNYTGYNITFNVTGNYLEGASFDWMFSNNIKQTTYVRYLALSFAADGSYTVTVTVSNAVSTSTTNLTFTVVDLLCTEPVITVNGETSRLGLRSRGLELAVSISASGCYVTVHQWKVYNATSCSSAGTELFPLNSVRTDTPILQIPKSTLASGTYCIVAMVSYVNTPVLVSQQFELTITNTPLTAVITGGDERSVKAESYLVLNASSSKDTNENTQVNLSYTWNCSQNMATTSAIAVCSAIRAITGASANLTNIQLAAGDIYNVTVTVSAQGKGSSSTTQTISVLSSSSPAVNIICVSCAANEIYRMNSKQISLIGECSECGTSVVSYVWSVTDGSGQPVTITNEMTKTGGTSGKNLVIRSGQLNPSVSYTFTLTVTAGSSPGFASISMVASSAPSGGNCAITGQNIVPLENKCTVTCRNYTDTDQTSGIYYRIVVSNSEEELPLYYGSQTVYSFYVAPFPGTNMADVYIQVYVSNDNGVEVLSLNGTVSFTAPPLSGSTNNVDFIIDNIKTNMVNIVNQNNPASLIQYSVSVLLFLNDQSMNNVGTASERMALRKLIGWALYGVPRNSLWDIQLLASAIKYLTEYSDELSSDTIDKASTEIENIVGILQSLVEIGKDPKTFETLNLLNSVNNLQEALQQESSPSIDSNLLAEFGDLGQYVLAVSTSKSPPVYSNEDERFQAMIQKSIQFSTQLMLVLLQTTVPNESINKTLVDGSVMFGAHRYTYDPQTEVSSSGVKLLIPPDVIANHIEDSAFQLYSQNEQIRLNFGFKANSIGATTKTFQAGFYAKNGDKIQIANLVNKIKMYMFNSSTTPYQISSLGLPYSVGYQPQVGVNMTSTSITSRRTFVTSIVPPSTYGTAMFIMVTPNFTSTSDTLTVTLYKNDVALEEKTISHAMLQGSHENYTFFVQNDNVNGAFKLHVYSTANVNVSVGKYHASCSFFNDTTSTWETNGCAPTPECIPTVIACECDHTTSFGGGIFVSPADIHFTDLAEVDIISNPVAIITCSVLLGLYILGVVICRRMDLLDIKRISSIPLCGKDGSFKYEVTVVTGRLPGAGTSANVGLRICGEYGKSARQHIAKDGAFRRNCTDTFIIAYDVNLGDLRKVQIWHDNSGMSPAWYLSYVLVNDLQTDQKYYFFSNTWLSLEQENGSIEKELKTAGAEDLNRFGHRMSTAMFNSLADKHLWVSLLNRPAQSRFTRVQRITCCVTLLFTFIGVNAMWYGLLKKDNTEIGFGEFGWEEIVLALVSNLMVFPVNLGIMFLFKKSRSKANVFEHIQKPQTAQTLEIENLCGNSQAGSFESHQTGAIPYDLDRESTIDSVPAQPSLGLRRSRNVTKTQRENTDDSLYRRPVVAVTSSSAKSPMWTEDNIMKWPETVPYDSESRPSTSSTMAGPTSIRHPPAKAGGSTPATVTKTKGKKNKCGPEQLLEELDKMEQDLKQTESRSLRSSESRRKPSMTKSTWEELEDILHSDDESVAGSSKKLGKKRGSMASQGSNKRFNPRTEPRIGGNGTHWPKPRDSIVSGTPDIGGSLTAGTSQGIAQGLRPGYFREMTVESRDIRQIPVHKEKCSLPPWCVYIGYVLCFLLSAFSVIIVILYCFQFGYDESLEWLLACFIALLLSVCLIEPFKALIIAVYVVAMEDNVEQDQDDDYIDIEPTFDNSSEKIKDVKFKPITGFALLQAKEEGRKIHRMNVMLRQFFAYVFYLWLVMAVVYINFKQDNYLQHSYIEKTFTETTTPSYVSFNNISSISEYWDWTENVLVDSLHLQDALTDEEHGYLLGAARMRLIRSTTVKCHAATAAAKLGASVLTDRICYGDSDYDEDTLFYGERWNDSSFNRSWKYNWANELGGTHKIGHAGTYGGGGYTQVLGTSLAETLTIVQDLKDKGWVDLRTRAVIVEFSMYSPGTDMTAMVALLIEFPLTGGAIASYEIQSQRLLWFMENRVDPLMVLECILLLVVVYSMIHIALRIRDLGKKFFKEFWNWYEMLTALMTIVSVGMYIGCVVQATNTFNNFLDDQTNFTNFEHVAYVHVGMRYLNAWLLFLLMYKVVKQLRFIRFLHVYEKTLSTAFGQLVATGLIFVIMLFIYAQIGYLIYGRAIAGFQTVGHAVNTLIVIIRGTFDFDPMLDIHPVFSHFYLYSFYAFAYGLMIALVIAVLISTYRITKSQMYFKSTLEMQDYEMIDFMMKRFKLWAGIQKPKPAFRRVRFPGLPSISSRSSSSYSNRSSASLQSAQSITDPEYSQVQLRCMMTRLTPTWQAVLRRFEKIEALDREEEDLVNRAENKMKDLNWKCRINQLEREHKEILEWKNTKSSAKPPVGDAKQRQSILKRLASKDNHAERKVPATVTGSTRSSATPPAKEVKTVKGKRPLSDQGARSDQYNTRTSTPEKSKIQKFFKSVKPSKPAWDK